MIRKDCIECRCSGTGEPVRCTFHNFNFSEMFDCECCHDFAPDMFKKPMDLPKPDNNVLHEADNLVHGDRGTAYGHPLDDFTCTAAMLDAVLHHKGKLKDDQHIAAEDIPLFMECVKISRECNSPKHDNRVDGAGYWETLEMVINERARREKK